MSVEKQIDLICDECDDHFDNPEWTVAFVRRQARAFGWKYRKGKDICDKCAHPNDGDDNE